MEAFPRLGGGSGGPRAHDWPSTLWPGICDDLGRCIMKGHDRERWMQGQARDLQGDVVFRIPNRANSDTRLVVVPSFG